MWVAPLQLPGLNKRAELPHRSLPSASYTDAVGALPAVTLHHGTPSDLKLDKPSSTKWLFSGIFVT